MSRLFTFGCSFTHWPWPTWADIIAHDLAIPYYNWGIPGLGNIAIQHRLTECDLRNSFNKDDIILVVWSTWTREDRYNVKRADSGGSGWNATGDVLHSYDTQFIDNYWSINNDLIKNSTAIISANKMFDIKFNGHIYTPLIDASDDASLYFTEHEKTIANFYQPHIPNDGVYNPKHSSYSIDTHPSILAHLKYVREVIEPKLGKPLRTTTIDYFTEMHNTVDDFAKSIDTSDNVDSKLKILSLLTDKFNWKTNDYNDYVSF